MALPKPYQPVTMWRFCDQAKTQGMARRSDSDRAPKRRAGREPIFSIAKRAKAKRVASDWASQIHDLVEEIREPGVENMREITLVLVLMALGDAQLGGPLSGALALPRSTARDAAERMLRESIEREGTAATQAG